MFLIFSGPCNRVRFCFLFLSYFLRITVKEKPFPGWWDDSASASQGLIGCPTIVISQPGGEEVEKSKKLLSKVVVQKLHSSLLFCSYPTVQNLVTWSRLAARNSGKCRTWVSMCLAKTWGVLLPPWGGRGVILATSSRAVMGERVWMGVG